MFARRIIAKILLLQSALTLPACLATRDATHLTQQGGQSIAGAGLPDGRFHGYVNITHHATRLPAVLDIVRIDLETDTPIDRKPAPRYRGFLRLSAGGFNSHEYGTSYFTDVSHDPATGTVRFEGGPDSVALKSVRYERGKLSGMLVAEQDDTSLPFELTLDRGDDPTGFDHLPVASHITGHYVAHCGENREVLQIEASRWRGHIAAETSLLGGYQIAARRGVHDEIRCGSKDVPCLDQAYHRPIMHLLTRTLRLHDKGPNCEVKENALHCDTNCVYVKDGANPHTVLDVISEEHRFPRKHHLTVSEQDHPDQNRTGQYYGYLHHENRDHYQLVAFNVRAEPAVEVPSGKPKLGQEHVAAVATLYFGGGDSSEFIAYRFHEVLASSAKAPIVFDGDGEAMLVVESWQGPMIRGVWYGKTYGRVGTVELIRDLVPELPANATTVRALTGHYQGEGGESWEFEIGATADLSEDASDFYPLKIFGWARERTSGSRRRSVEDGAYDFYTGAVAFRLDDRRTVIGRVRGDQLELHWAPMPHLGAQLKTAEYQLFKRLDGVSRPQANRNISH